MRTLSTSSGVLHFLVLRSLSPTVETFQRPGTGGFRDNFRIFDTQVIHTCWDGGGAHDGYNCYES